MTSMTSFKFKVLDRFKKQTIIFKSLLYYYLSTYILINNNNNNNNNNESFYFKSVKGIIINCRNLLIFKN